MSADRMMEVDPPTNFPTKDDEVKYWKELAYEMYQRSETTMSELQEYQESSQCLEKELETSFWESDKKNRDLSYDNVKLIAQNEELRVKLTEQITAYDALQSEMQDVKLKNIQLANNLRNLEQKNDDLERDNRALKMMEEEMDTRYNDAIEKIALLETDLLEENYAKFDVERLEKENGVLKSRIEQLQEENRCDFIRSRKDSNHVRFSTQHRISFNAACSPADSLRRSSEVKLKINDTLSPVKRKAQEDIPQVHIHPTRKEKYNTEGRDLSQAFALYKKKQHQELDCEELNRSIEVRTKKVKEEEKRQKTLSSFVRRLRSARDQLLRKYD